ncbi:MAG: hypothetical protein H6622_12005 [Halobacteriovoraceae bacterium]|nr:hypothetical protein [Halobacteriovoraceae bacterium]
MKFLFGLLFISLSFNGQASLKKAYKYYRSKDPSKYEKMTYQFINSKYYFSALNSAKLHLEKTEKLSNKFSKALEVILMKTGKEAFMDIEIDVLKKFSDPTINFLLGMKYFNERNYELAQKYLKNVEESNKNIVESVFVLGVISSNFNKDKDAQKYYNRCQNLSSVAADQVKNEKLKKYYILVAEKCIIHSARLYYRSEDFQKALEIYDLIPKTSYNWPFILLEKAWVFYKLGDYNRTLGIITTYKSPLLSEYFYPESEVLMSLAYFKLCLWDDSINVINNYYEEYKKRSNQLKTILDKYKDSEHFFFNLIMSNKETKIGNTFFMRNMKTKMKKTVKYSLDLIAYNESKDEYKRIKKLPNNSLKRIMAEWVLDDYELIKLKMNHFVKKNMFQTVNEIYSFSAEMFNIKLEISSKKRSLLYKNQKLISGRSRGSHENVKRDTFQFFWEFKGSFWADELGDYSFGLESNCKSVKVGPGAKS